MYAPHTGAYKGTVTTAVAPRASYPLCGHSIRVAFLAPAQRPGPWKMFACIDLPAVESVAGVTDKCAAVAAKQLDLFVVCILSRQSSFISRL